VKYDFKNDRAATVGGACRQAARVIGKRDRIGSTSKTHDRKGASGLVQVMRCEGGL
jgi:hypothetical protein